MTAQELMLDYFNFYDVANQSAGYVIGLQGQFDKQPEKAQLTYLNLFANPVSKNGEPIYDKNAHFTWYDMYDPVPDPPRVVVYQNQFGKSKLITGRSYALLAPCWKYEKGSAFPEKLDHYRLYQVLQAEPVNKAVKTQDQWASGETRLYDPIFFGVPVTKWWQGEVSKVQNPKAHLVLYRSYPAPAQKTALTIDQFGKRYIQAFRSILFGAPSVKLEWKEL